MKTEKHINIKVVYVTMTVKSRRSLKFLQKIIFTFLLLLKFISVPKIKTILGKEELKEESDFIQIYNDFLHRQCCQKWSIYQRRYHMSKVWKLLSYTLIICSGKIIKYEVKFNILTLSSRARLSDFSLAAFSVAILKSHPQKILCAYTFFNPPAVSIKLLRYDRAILWTKTTQ